MKTIRIVDLFCGGGGCSVGYDRAFREMGFEVDITGVDIAPQPHYPYRFVRGDAMTFNFAGYDFAHASCPCQDYSSTRYILHKMGTQKSYPRLIEPIRQRLIAAGIPWVIENVRLALSDMWHPLMICGTSLGLRVQRHRLFDASMLLMSPGRCSHRPGDIGVYGEQAIYLGTKRKSYVDGQGATKWRKYNAQLAEAQRAMGIDWMTFAELSQAIPPAYTYWIGRQIAQALEAA